jgi:hypothetical protein
MTVMSDTRQLPPGSGTRRAGVSTPVAGDRAESLTAVIFSVKARALRTSLHAQSRNNAA